ncbi:putative quinol monooxygenase [Halobellus litoreus]|uniref:Quinol monooxygenase n=1 Tax=Halobellus litoreus TaxID=755310 RepID=A0ABD6E356_9EURY|nr:hypothetical protein [Halobellus litoreus]
MTVRQASFPITPEKRSEALDLGEDLLEQSNQEAGAIDYQAATDVRDENTSRFLE